MMVGCFALAETLSARHKVIALIKINVRDFMLSPLLRFRVVAPGFLPGIGATLEQAT
jgi:hypothetical protein